MAEAGEKVTYGKAQELIRIIGTNVGVSPYGEIINFRGLVHAPMNEQGVVFLFGMIFKELGYTIERVQAGFPDCKAKKETTTKKGNFTYPSFEDVSIEFEFESKSFFTHGHNISQCQLIICWRHNWPDCPIEVLELKSAIQKLKSDV